MACRNFNLRWWFFQLTLQVSSHSLVSACNCFICFISNIIFKWFIAFLHQGIPFLQSKFLATSATKVDYHQVPSLTSRTVMISYVSSSQDFLIHIVALCKILFNIIMFCVGRFLWQRHNILTETILAPKQSCLLQKMIVNWALMMSCFRSLFCWPWSRRPYGSLLRLFCYHEIAV